MGRVIDLHVHTRRYSGCSRLDEEGLIEHAGCAGLDGLVITEHHYQWSEEELEDLAGRSGKEGFLLLAGFEYSSSCGDILVYGLQAGAAEAFEPYLDAEEAAAAFHALGGVCVVAHPTRRGSGFDGPIHRNPFDGIEVQSVNLEPHEQRAAAKLAADLGLPGTGGSDAHQIEDVGAYATEFDDSVGSMADLVHHMRSGRFRAV